MKYIIQGKRIEIDLDEKVFTPSPHGSHALGEAIKVSSGESVLDVGTGTGILAILSAKLGGIVTAVDSLPAAVKLAKSNSEKNNVSLDIKLGNLFGPVDNKEFDVIIANVPQENLSPKLLLSLSPEAITGMHGGNNGNSILLSLLKEAPTYMHSTSRLYVVVYSMSNFRESLNKIIELYNAKLINFYTGPVKEFVYKDSNWYEEKLKEGLIDMYKKADEFYADLFVFELKLK